MSQRGDRETSWTISGMGVVTAVGVGIAEFGDALRSGRGGFGVLRRPGRESEEPFVGAEIDEAALPPRAPSAMRRTLSLTARAAIAAVDEALGDAELDARHPQRRRVGLVLGGDSFQLRERQLVAERSAARPLNVLPSYAVSFWDSDLLSILSEVFALRGECYATGGASAGGAVAVIHAARQLAAGELDAVVVVGPLCDLSALELRALANLGALGGGRSVDDPQRAYRPFDRERDGFVFGEGCAALVLERGGGSPCRGRLLGWGQVRDGRRGPEPAGEGQRTAIADALAMAGLAPRRIDYVNPHGSGSPRGDRVELETLRAAGLDHCLINSTKSITGHCLTASGALEVVATLLQLAGGFAHPSRNLDRPEDPELRWVRDRAVEADLELGLSTSYAFGGLSTALVLASPAGGEDGG